MMQRIHPEEALQAVMGWNETVLIVCVRGGSSGEVQRSPLLGSWPWSWSEHLKHTSNGSVGCDRRPGPKETFCCASFLWVQMGVRFASLSM